MKILFRFSIKCLEGFAIPDRGATKTVSGFMRVQPVADRYEDTTIETTDVGFTFAGGETEAASTKICIPHAEFSQGVSVNVVSNESTPFLIGLDVLREYGLVIDYHCNRDHSHILKRYLLCAVSAGRRGDCCSAHPICGRRFSRAPSRRTLIMLANTSPN